VLQGLQPLPVLARAAIKGVSEDCAGSCGKSANSLRAASTFERAERQANAANQYRHLPRLTLFNQNIHYLSRSLIIIALLVPHDRKLRQAEKMSNL
jgi:hypothetical protein